MLQPIMPLVYEVVDPASRQTTVVDLLLEVFGLIGGIIIIAVLAGVLAAGFPHRVSDALATEFLQRRRK